MDARSDPVEGAVDPLAETVANLPLLHLVGGLVATLFPVACGIGVLVLVSSALFSLPEITLSETTYAGSWLLVRFGPLLLILGGLAGTIAYGTWTGKRWIRGLVIAFWTLCIAFASLAAILHPVGGGYGGQGLGLAMAKMTVQLHNGRIWAEPCAGGGNKFVFTVSSGPSLEA